MISTTKTLVGALIGLALTLAALLAAGNPPAFLGEGAAQHPVMTACFLAWVSFMAGALDFHPWQRGDW